MTLDLDARRTVYSKLSSRLAGLDDTELRRLLSAEGIASRGGTFQTVQVDGIPVFVKRIPLTEVEHAHAFSTRNHYRIPVFYSYALGSVGFNAFRELLSHIKTTGWVLAGEIETFPLTYHHRILARRAAQRIDEGEHAAYVRFWNSSVAVSRYVRDRADAPYELVVFGEHLRAPVSGWLNENLDEVDVLLERLFATITFLRTRRIVHFDAQFLNVFADDDRPYLTDFGLMLDASFHLSERERSFLAAHAYFDYGSIASCLSFPLLRMVAPDAQAEVNAAIGYAEGRPLHEYLFGLVREIDVLVAKGLVAAEGTYLAALRRYRDPILYFGTFMATLQSDTRKRTLYEDERMRRLLELAGAPIA